MFTRKEIFELLKKYVKSESLLRHSFAVEAGMIAYAKKYGEDVDEWETVGLLHDIDFELYPGIHPLKSVDILTEAGYSEEFVNAVKGHFDDTNTKRETKMAKTLHAVDEFASFTVTVALMRPTKLEGIKYKSSKKSC